MALATLRVIVCGTDFNRVESTLSGTVENTNYAWNRRYGITCTSALGLDDVDTRLLSMCHLVVIGKGTRPASTMSYNNKPTVSIDGAPENVLINLAGCTFYYGAYSIKDLRDVILDTALSPIHIIWDSVLRCLTVAGELGLRRAFWLLDKDSDELLNEEEILSWQRSIRSSSFSKSDIHDLFDGDIPDAAAVQIDLEQFLIMQRRHLEENDARRVWATLHITGILPDGMPFSWRDVHTIRVTKESNTYLSHTAIQFFRNLYKLRRFQNMDDIWSVTPGCPWENVIGFHTKGIPLDKFIEYWKFMALSQREVVVRYARYWGYKGDTSLLFLLRHARPFREVGESVPNTIQVLVVGAQGCGRRSLIFTLTAGEEDCENESAVQDGTYVRTTTFFVRNGVEEVPQTIVYVTVPFENVNELFRSEALEKQIDVVLLCYDGSRVADTASCIMETYLDAKKVSPCCNLPFVVVMTKAENLELVGNDAEVTKGMQNFCREHQLLWPPVVTSVESPEDSEVVALNEYMYALAREPEIGVGKPPLTPMRIARRVVIVTLLVFAVGKGIRSLLRWARRRK